MSLQVSDKLQGLRGDVFGGMTAAVVALPLSLAFGVASGLGAIEGLYSAVVVGMLAALLGGSRTQISGPTAPLSVAMAVVFVDYADGELKRALAIVAMAGIIQVLLGALRLGTFVAYTPYAVVSGFTSAVGLIIIIVQVLPFFGAEVALGGALKSLREWPDAVANVDPSALTLGLVTLAVCVFWPGRLQRILPPSVAALIIGTLVGVLWLSEAPTIGEVPTGLPDLVVPEISIGDLGSALPAAVTIALLGSINSLLTARVADSLTRQNHDPSRELMGAGAANVVVAFIGGVPGAGATSCTVANVKAGGRSRVSGVLCATILAALVLGLGRYVDAIPHAVLAGILIKIGFNIIDWRYLAHIHRVPRENVVVLALTLVLSIVSDLVIAVAVGLVMAALTGARQVERLELDKVISTPLLDMTFLADPEADDGAPDLDDDPFAARVGLLSLRGSFTSASSTRLFKTINHDMAEHEVVIFDFTETAHVDDSAALAIGQLADTARDADTQCIVLGMSGMTDTSVHALDVLREIPEENFVEDLDEARIVARRLLG
ncbi:MAG: SulP family inorganic anion transporter [Acidimicrobiaceae bacterium]|nr:SulP family inorganic anion transporter [Acidimicrobiaceae bacterium]MXZ97741.1 SulP family inorganic anion transporter [Acidimicrobiaceae bacterium]MYI52660.1 SulP family inorganic anion transporter [Acidimicrobiaceae bacterium]MYJ41552.1 SulP family inorganic anion transporter [Acidimicrobiaceae bacterium]